MLENWGLSCYSATADEERLYFSTEKIDFFSFSIFQTDRTVETKSR